MLFCTKCPGTCGEKCNDFSVLRKINQADNGMCLYYCSFCILSRREEKRIWRILGHPGKIALRNAVDWDELLRR